MIITDADSADLDEAVDCMVAAFAQDPITSYLLQAGPAYQGRLAQFFSLLMRARLALGMPVLVGREGDRIAGGTMGYSTAPGDWPRDVASDWDRFEKSIPGITDRIAVYDEISAKGKPTQPHYYLGVIAVAPGLHGKGFGKQLLEAFCARSASDPLSSGVYLETASEANVAFYRRAGFVETHRSSMGAATLSCMFLEHRR